MSIEINDVPGYVHKTELVVRERYTTGEVITPTGELLWLKASNDPSSVAAEDLRNEIEWSANVNRLTADREKFWRVPKPYWSSGDGRWAVFEHIDGRPPNTDEELPWWVGAGTHILGDLLDIQYEVDGELQDVNNWLGCRLKQASDVLDSAYFNQQDRQQFRGLLGIIGDIDFIEPGLVHGDFKLSNLMLANKDSESVVLVDAEFGTTFDRRDWETERRRTEWDKPRMHDTAYFSHLLHVSHRMPEMAEGVLSHLIHMLTYSETTINLSSLEAEFRLSLIERTLSMMRHFVLNPDKETNEPNRLEPEPYVTLIRDSLSRLRSMGLTA